MRSPLEYIACRYFLLWSLSCTSSKCVSVLIRIRYCNAQLYNLLYMHFYMFCCVIVKPCTYWGCLCFVENRANTINWVSNVEPSHRLFDNNCMTALKPLTVIFTLRSGRYVDCNTHHQQRFPTTFLSFPQLHLCGCILTRWLFLEGESCRMISSYALWCTVDGSLRSDIAQCFTFIVHSCT